MPRYKVAFNFDVEFECQEEDINNEVKMWWSENLDIPDYKVTELKEE